MKKIQSHIAVAALFLLLAAPVTADSEFVTGAKKVSAGIREMAVSTGKAFKESGKAVAKGFKQAGTETGKAFKTMGSEIREAFSGK